ncbi:cohesin domain-containing protein [Paenibacillus dokdonensis]|uniref:cohesin domain-containing protein n=1 Tax=Paenibacillus dokdonensis TaxID=2567944 RepID=UPI0010A8E51E|nr:cohesin domain-containing protein [Paenibacillus dokdonensis]
MMTVRMEKKWMVMFAVFMMAAWLLLSSSTAHAASGDEVSGTAVEQNSGGDHTVTADQQKPNETGTPQEAGNVKEQGKQEPSQNAAATSAGQQSVTLKASVEQAAPGQSFTIKYGVSGVTGNVFAQDITIEYDPAVMEYVADSIKVLKEGVTVVNDPSTQAPGSLRIILASMGAQNAVTGTGDILELGFKAAAVDKETDGVLRIIQATLSNEIGEEFNMDSTSVTVKIKSGSAVSGDVNGDGKVSIGDLAMIAAKYGMDSTSPNWNDVKKFDLDNSGAIDVGDLSIVAKKIIEQP